MDTFDGNRLPIGFHIEDRNEGTMWIPNDPRLDYDISPQADIPSDDEAETYDSGDNWDAYHADDDSFD